MGNDKIIKMITERCDIFYDDALISKEKIIGKYLMFFAKQFDPEERSVNFAFHTGSLCFDAASIAAITIGCLAYEFSSNDEILSELQIGDLVLYKKERYHEKQECKELFDYARIFDNSSDASLALSIILFENTCATKVKTELSSYIKHLGDSDYNFKRIGKYPDFGELLIKVRDCNKYDVIRAICEWIENSSEFKFCRKELHREMLHSVNYAQENNISIEEAANRVRKDVTLQRRYMDFKFLSSRTLLSKGLEFDCAIIDAQSGLTAKEFYVAMTRAMKKIIIISTSSSLMLTP